MEFSNKNLWKLLLIPSLLVSTTTYAAYESINHIAKVANDFVISNIQLEPDETIDVKINHANIPMQLAECNKELDAAFPRNANRERINAVEIACNGDKPWQTLVPVYVDIATKVLVAKHALQAHDTITADDVELASYSKNRLYSGYFKNPEEVIGNVATYPIAAGTVITKKNMQQPKLIHSNQSLNVISRHNAVMITMQGIAKSDGGMNDVIKVFNPSSKRTIDAVVVGPNRAEIVG